MIYRDFLLLVRPSASSWLIGEQMASRSGHKIEVYDFAFLAINYYNHIPQTLEFANGVTF